MQHYLRDLHLINFKNFADFEATDLTKINILVGRNGVGKTNILESIHYLAMCKPYFNHNYEQENIKFGESFFAIHGHYGSNDNGFTKFSCTLKADEKKKMRANDTPYQRFSDHIGIIPVVVVSPSDHVLVEGGADYQRTFLNYTLSQCDRDYLETLKDYNKALEMRNRLLRNAKTEHVFDNTQLESLDYLLANAGNKIRQKRQTLCEKLRKGVEFYHKFLSENAENADLNYETFEGEDLFPLLQMNLKREIMLGFTSSGAHKDRLNITINNHNARNFASQGQQKSLLLALKLAQFDWIRQQKQGQKPLLLLDDLFDKFDFERVCRLFSLLANEQNQAEKGSFGQIFITDTHLKRVEEMLEKDVNPLRKICNSDLKITLLE